MSNPKIKISMRTKHLITARPVRITPVGCEASIVVNASGTVHVDKVAPRGRRLPDERLASTGLARLLRTPGGQRRRLVVNLPTGETTEDRLYHEVDRLIEVAKLKGVL